jgi:hypothetical protein
MRLTIPVAFIRIVPPFILPSSIGFVLARLLLTGKIGFMWKAHFVFQESYGSNFIFCDTNAKFPEKNAMNAFTGAP